MNALGLLLFSAFALGLFALPRRWAPVALFLGCCYLTTGQAFLLGSFSLPAFRLLLLFGLLRILLRGERLPGGFSTADRLMLLWGAWTCFASLFQPTAPGSGLKFVVGMVFNIVAAYFVLRILCRNESDTRHLLRCLCLLLVPVALAMLYEKFRGQNLFALLGNVPEVPLVRDGRIRAQGPFGHPILAGTIGATCFPFAVALWSQARRIALVGGAACVLMTLATASSGPIMSLLFGLFGVFMWRHRAHCGRLRKLAVLGYLVLLVVMDRAPYYLISRINLTGSSTGWHRSYLIQQAIGHFNEWALIGTNRTRHWMPNQGHISDTSTDITNYFIWFGVLGGFLCLALVVALLYRSFKAVGEYVRHPATKPEECFLVWCLGATLFAHTATGFSVSYYGQTVVFFWLPVALIASLRAGVQTSPVAPRVPSRPSPAAAVPVSTAHG